MKLDKTGKNIAAMAAIALGTIYFLGGILYSIPQPVSEILWGLAILFACLNWFTEES